jgi:hypothetical protein
MRPRLQAPRFGGGTGCWVMGRPQALAAVKATGIPRQRLIRGLIRERPGCVATKATEHGGCRGSLGFPVNVHRRRGTSAPSNEQARRGRRTHGEKSAVERWEPRINGALPLILGRVGGTLFGPSAARRIQGQPKKSRLAVPTPTQIHSLGMAFSHSSWPGGGELSALPAHTSPGAVTTRTGLVAPRAAGHQRVPTGQNKALPRAPLLCCSVAPLLNR